MSGEHVGFLHQFRGAAVRAGRRVLLGHDELAALLAGPRRDAVTPPYLTADAPVADVVEPVVIGLHPVFRENLGHFRHGGAGAGRELGGGHEPLFGHVRFHHGLAAVAVAHAVVEVLDLHELAGCLQILNDALTACFLGQTRVGARLGGHVAVLVDALDEFEAVALAERPVVGIVAGGDLERAGAEFLVHVTVREQRHGAADDGHDDLLAHKARIAFVLGMHAYAGVRHDRFGAGRGDDHRAGAVLEVVADVVQMALFGQVVHFVVGEGGVAAAAPVDDVLALVDVALFVEFHEHLADGFRQALVHREAFAGPVHGVAEHAYLVEDAVAVVLLPLPDAFDELFAAKVVAGLAFLGEGAFHHVLGGDARVVGAGEPQHLFALLAGVAAEHVDEGMVQGVADVQRARNVRRRNDNGERFARTVGIGGEGLVLFPVFAPVVFHGVGLVALG